MPTRFRPAVPPPTRRLVPAAFMLLVSAAAAGAQGPAPHGASAPPSTATRPAATPASAPAAPPVSGPRARDPFRAPAVKGVAGAPQEVQPPLPGEVTSILVAGPRSVVTFRDGNDRLTIVGIGEQAGAWTVQSVRDDGAVLTWRGRAQSYTRLAPLRRGSGVSPRGMPSAGDDTQSALPAGDIPLLPPVPVPSKPNPQAPAKAAPAATPSRPSTVVP